ncbi:MAG TPA: oxidoreductase [Gammaproteobacteria bacterium]|nr:oxidoreductase [Gammaproteobacteria bacterium]
MQKIRLGMVGGGQGAFIGEVHRIASRIDNRFDLVAGALSSDPTRAAESAVELGISTDRSYANFADMAIAESAREDGIQAVSIVTPNHLHFPVAKVFLEAGIHVICDKPLTSTLEEAVQLTQLSKRKNVHFAVTYNYSAYPMVRQAREMIAAGRLGSIRVIQIEYAQDWLATDLEANGQKQAAWRTDPAKAGAGGSIGDIGTHAFHLSEFISGLRCDSLLADLESFVGKRRLDDNAHILIRYDTGAKGMLWASQVATGKENGLKISIYGAKAGLSWTQENPNYLSFTAISQATQILSRGGPNIGGMASAASRIPAGHPEGFLEGFATLYSDIADLILGKVSIENSLVPTVEDGLRGMQFVDAAVKSNKADSSWVKLVAE